VTINIFTTKKYFCLTSLVEEANDGDLVSGNDNKNKTGNAPLPSATRRRKPHEASRLRKERRSVVQAVERVVGLPPGSESMILSA
jgi:hypothetical protein